MRPALFKIPYMHDKVVMLKLSADIIYINAEHRRKHLDKWVFLCVGGAGKCHDINRKIVRGVADIKEYGENIQSFDDILWWVNFWKERKSDGTKKVKHEAARPD